MSFTIKFDNGDLEKLSINLASQNLLSPIVPDVNMAINKFHNALEERVNANFKVPYSLDTVRRPSSPITSNLSMEYSLVYADTPVPLAKYKYTTTKVKVRNAIPFMYAENKIRYTPINKAKSVRVTIKNGRGGVAATPRKRTQFKKFLIDNENTKGIFVRLTKPTWEEIPNPENKKGVRNKNLKLLFGPSVARLAISVYNKDIEMDKAKDTLSKDILNAFTRNFK